MSIGPSSPQARRGSDSLPFTSANRSEQIRRRWSFLDGLNANKIKLTGSFSGAEILVLNASGEIEPSTRLTGTITFDDVLSVTGTDFIVAVDAFSILAGAESTALIGTDNQAGRPVYVGDDAPAVASTHLGKVDLTAQTADITTTALSSTPLAGMYEVEVYLMTTTADAAAGTLAVTIGWTDAIGATTSNVIAAHALTATGRSTGRQILNLASSDITYAVTNAGGYGTSAYAIAVRVVSLG